MAQYFDNGNRAFPYSNTSSVPQYSRVKLTTLNGVPAIDVAAHTDREIGVAMDPAYVQGAPVNVKLCTAQGTVPMIASGAISLGAAVYSDDNGQVSATDASGAMLIGHALTAATGAGAIIEVLRVAANA